jgi:hypothetical protein
MLQGILAQNLIFIDESGFNLALTRLSARFTKGSRAHGKRPQKRGKNVSIIGAISLKGVAANANIIGSVDGLTLGMGPWASGKPCLRYFPPRRNSGAGCIRPLMCSTNSPSVSRARRNGRSGRFNELRAKLRPIKPLIVLLRSIRRSILRLPSV